MNVHTLRARPITSEEFEPFGQVIGIDDIVIEARNGERLHLDILSKTYEPLDITSFNRHFKATQAQIALDGKPSVIVVGPPSTELDREADLETLRAFICDGSVGFNIKIGTWHAGAYPLMGSVRLVNLQGHAPSVDIEIRDIVKVLGVKVQILI